MLFRKATPEFQTIWKHCLATNLKTSPNHTYCFVNFKPDPSPLRIAVGLRVAITFLGYQLLKLGVATHGLSSLCFRSCQSSTPTLPGRRYKNEIMGDPDVYRVPSDLQRLSWLYVEWMHESCQDLADTHKIHPLFFPTPWPETWTAAIAATTRPPTTTSSWQPSYPSHYLHHDVNGSWLSSNSVCWGNTMDILLEKYTEWMESSDIYSYKNIP